jgi:hypothetical protein
MLQIYVHIWREGYLKILKMSVQHVKKAGRKGKLSGTILLWLERRFTCWTTLNGNDGKRPSANMPHPIRGVNVA